MLRPELLRLFPIHISANDRNALGDFLVHDFLYFYLLLCSHRFSIREIDAQSLAREVAPPLVHVWPERHLERFEEQVVGGVVAHGLFRVVGEAAREFLRRSRARERLVLVPFLLPVSPIDR